MAECAKNKGGGMIKIVLCASFTKLLCTDATSRERERVAYATALVVRILHWQNSFLTDTEKFPEYRFLEQRERRTG